MHVEFDQFDADKFSFHDHQVLVIDNFWSAAERKFFQRAMLEASWKALHDSPQLRATFPNCGNWLKADIARSEGTVLLNRVGLSCIRRYIESFPGIVGRHLNFNYYSYGAGDCLLTHDDVVRDHQEGEPINYADPLRRLALVTYLHDEWQPDWGGELIIYDMAQGRRSQSDLSITHCIAPKPGALVLFTVPRYHRVCRVDAVSGTSKRLSIAGWFMTEHQPETFASPHESHTHIDAPLRAGEASPYRT
ncbi:hypothetical protein W02_09840 [Nitrospira sp. KM1]|uniref:2OG-Fe(II) oxygenase n=1 Tax=Nitrospira sp. KM1 TaxID=1936990 RepID=UPI0013A74315|nr:2OG-Fe(II) oxygenase family protein [Nitrospira sp. KM1]BCA53844.1 hypothetical protein W02_09840 [Nitrospira sp. KM1]